MKTRKKEDLPHIKMQRQWSGMSKFFLNLTQYCLNTSLFFPMLAFNSLWFWFCFGFLCGFFFM